MRDALEYLISIGAECTPEVEKLPPHLVYAHANYRLENIERSLPSRTRYRTQITTGAVGDFAEIISRFGVAGERECFIDRFSMTARTFFNLGTEERPGHGDHFVELTPPQTPEFAEAMRVDGVSMSQREAAEWLEDWREFLTPVWADDHGTRATLQNAINTIRNVQVAASRDTDHGAGDFSATKSEVERIEARGREMPLPAFFEFQCVPYDGLSEVVARLRVSVITGDSPRVTYRIVARSALERAIAESFRSIVSESVEGLGVAITIGGISL